MEGTISTSSGKTAGLTFALRTLTQQERRRNAFKALGLCWALSLLTAPLPPIHWLTVPGFFVFGIVLFARKLREGLFFEELAFPCPECSKEIKLAPQVRKNPLEFVCPHCRYGMKLAWDEGPASA